MAVLGIDTATAVCSVGLVDHSRVLGEYSLINKRTHSQRLLPLIDRLLKDSRIELKEIEAVAVSKGPGSFTGIRIGMATAKGLAQSLGIPAIGIPTLDIIAAQFVYTTPLVCPILDARRHEVYTAIYNNEGPEPQRLTDYLALSLESLLEVLVGFNSPRGVLFPGDALDVYADYLKDMLRDRYLPLPHPYRYNRGSLCACLGETVFLNGDYPDLYTLSPLYVRRPEAEVKLALRKGGKDS
ncbi:MAG TPA: tRNA (adenosine(37)-N6)-threonylcarbamoyltransferase complex dimerization subunit type 1 TsaB [Firmicutes bacterium]|nr:tRNA (adenosine(37)-N6)-threonylcarbamoyltransferase complex dimerization subunit type 1 TsaB [Bacillota bacterium]